MPDSKPDTVRLTIDGTTIAVPKGTLVIEAARRVGVMIPHFCYHPKLKPDANCRMCLVEVEKMPKLQTACSTPVAEGMVVRTATTVVDDAHKSVLEFILANHPLDCPVCDQGGRCDLQDFSHQYTPTTSRFIETKRIFQKEYFSPLIETQMNRCVQCLRCVRYCDEIMDVKALAPVGRGTMTEIKHFGPHQLDCEFCGGCVQICPVGAITSRLSMYEYRPWMLKRADTICTYCGDGCRITVQTKDNQLIEVNSSHGAGRNNGDLCARGYFGFHATSHPDRLTHPLIRRDGTLTEATWEDALEYVAEQATRLKLAHGPDTFGGLITSRCTNEDLYVFQKFMRQVIGTNQIDSSARYGHLNGVQALRRVQGTHRWTIAFEDIVAADTLLLVGTNITETSPITGLKVKEAVKKRQARLITVETLQLAIDTLSNIVNLAAQHFPTHPTQFGNSVIGLIKAVIEGNLVDAVVAQEAPAFVQRLTEALQGIAWEGLEAATGQTRSQWVEAAQTLAASKRLVILVGNGVLRHPGGQGTVTNLLDLLILLGKLDSPGCGVAPLAEENNDQGAVEMGTVAEFFPGPAPVNDQAARERIATVWREELPRAPGASLTQMLAAADRGTLKALFVVGENPAGTLPVAANAKEALAKLDLLVCQELFLTETAAMAHVVLPACSYMEKNGTFTNSEGHVQAVRQAIDPVGDSRPDWEMFSVLSVLMGSPLEYGEAREILKEIRSVIPGYGLLGPTPTQPKVDKARLHHYLAEGFSADLATRYGLASSPHTGANTFTMLFVQTLFHSGKFSTRSKGLLQLQQDGFLSINPEDANRLGLAEGGQVRVSNPRGSVTTTVKIRARVPVGVVWFPEHFDGEAKQLADWTIDPQTQIPYFKLAQVSLAKVS
ncbi:MAG: NADH-ubiquinone oxidoreductase chain G [Nitrospira sp.]|jgi:formate dehydrogenase alpha subunit|nr:MAG: NADH-ubiquinone oxidoreductase chain G [Nitrospira sp.]